MSKSILVDGLRKNIDSNDNKLKNRSYFHNSERTAANPKILLFTLYLTFSIGCITSLKAQPYNGNVNDISWARYVAPSPLAMEANSFNDYNDQDSDVDHAEGIIEDAPEKETKKNVSITQDCVFVLKKFDEFRLSTFH